MRKIKDLTKWMYLLVPVVIFAYNLYRNGLSWSVLATTTSIAIAYLIIYHFADIKTIPITAILVSTGLMTAQIVTTALWPFVVLGVYLILTIKLLYYEHAYHLEDRFLLVLLALGAGAIAWAWPSIGVVLIFIAFAFLVYSIKQRPKMIVYQILTLIAVNIALWSTPLQVGGSLTIFIIDVGFIDHIMSLSVVMMAVLGLVALMTLKLPFRLLAKIAILLFQVLGLLTIIGLHYHLLIAVYWIIEAIIFIFMVAKSLEGNRRFTTYLLLGLAIAFWAVPNYRIYGTLFFVSMTISLLEGLDLKNVDVFFILLYVAAILAAVYIL